MHAAVGRSSGESVAIKIIDLDGLSTDMDDIRQEVATLRLCSHPNVLQFHAAFGDRSNKLWLVTKLMKKGSCLHVMNVAQRKGFAPGMHEDWLAWILQETLKALQYFHAQNQIHRDVKAGNILLDEEGRVALADFGVSRWVNQNQSQKEGKPRTFVGTPCWMAPEVMEQLDGYDFKADIWSLGITALELAKGQAPYATYAPMKVLLYTIQNDPPSLKSYADERRDNAPFSRAFKELVRLCLQKEPARRPTASHLLATSRLFASKQLTSEKLQTDLLRHISNVDDAAEPSDGVDMRAELSKIDASLELNPNAATALASSALTAVPSSAPPSDDDFGA